MVVIIYRHVPKRHVNFETTNYGIGQGVNVVVNCVPHSESEWTNQTLSGTKQQKFPTPFRLCSFKQALTNLTLTVCIFRAADWKLDAPDWTGRMRVTARGKVAYVKLEDKISGERKADETAPLFSFLAGNPSVALFLFFFVRQLVSVSHPFQGDLPRTQGSSLCFHKEPASVFASVPTLCCLC